AKHLKVKTFGFPTDLVQSNPDASITHYEATSWESCSLTIRINNKDYHVTLPNVGRHLALGAAAALLAADAAGVDLNLAAKALSKVKLPPMRMEVVERDGINWVLDMYNAAPASTIAALETVAEVAKGLKFAVLGEMRELGPASEEGHREVGAALARLGFLAAITLDAPGEESTRTRAGRTVETLGGTPEPRGPTRWIIEAALESGMSASNLTHASSFEEVRQWLSTRRAGDTILIKGSRGVELERVIPKWD
ncbi:MAG: cyanophycin synthetase, partial [Fimbriimonadaceae bacterium]